MEKIVEQFEKDYRAYLDASIRFAELQDPYQPLDSEREIKWLKAYFAEMLLQQKEELT